MDRRHRYLFISTLFILVGLMHIYPDIRFIRELGKDFQGISLMGSADETVYLTKVAAVIYRGDTRLANAGVYGHGNDPIFAPALSEVIEGSIGGWLGLAPWQIDIAATFVLPIIICFIIYLLVFNLTDSSKFGVLATLGVVIGYYWMTPNLKAILTLSPEYLHNALFFVRPISPQFQFVPFMLSLYLIYKLIVSRHYYFVAPAVIFTGYLFYTNIYYWTFVYAGLGVLLIIDLFRKKLNNLIKYVSVIFISLLVGLPYWLSYWAMNKLPYFDEVFKRQGGIYTRMPIFSWIGIISLLFLVIMRIILKSKREQFYYLISFVAGGLVCLNQQIITGKTIQPIHWEFQMNKVFIIIALFVSAAFILNAMEKNKYFKQAISLLKKNIIFYLICIVLLAMGFYQQTSYYLARREIFRQRQGMAGVLAYIHKNTPDNSVILTDPFKETEEQMISVFTKNYPYISGSFFVASTINEPEIRERYLFALHFFNYTPQEAEKFFSYANGGSFRGMQVLPIYGGTPEINMAYIEGLKRDYKELIKYDKMVLLRKYKVDYVLLAKRRVFPLFADKNIVNILELEYEDALYSLYKIRDSY